MASEQLAIEVQDLIKQYPRSPRNAVDGATFNVRRGEIFGLLGPNGAGKTTTLGVLTTGILPTGGTARIMGIDVVSDPMAVKQHIAVMPQKVNLDQSLRVREILTFHAAYHGVPKSEREARADTLLRDLGLEGRGKEKIGWYSGGMGQRVMLARALMHTPNMLFLDEPTNNLDPQSRLFLWDRIKALNEQGTTILLTTHDMEEADRLCERIAIMDNGKFLVIDTPNNLKKLIPGGTCLELSVHLPQSLAARTSSPIPADAAASTAHSASASIDQSSTIVESIGYMKYEEPQPIHPLLEALAKLPGVTKVEEDDRKNTSDAQAGQWGQWQSQSTPALQEPARQEQQPDTRLIRLYGEYAGELVTSVVRAIEDAGAELRDLHLARPTLEGVFIYLTGRRLRA